MNVADHGGPDDRGVAAYDFSTNANACGPCPITLAALQQADLHHYPDPLYKKLSNALAEFYGVSVQRIVLAGSASEFIFRITAWASQQGIKTASMPRHHYGDYSRAAVAHRLSVSYYDAADKHEAEPKARLIWGCEPSSPLGGAGGFTWQNAADIAVLDFAYAPLRLSGQPTLTQDQRNLVWQLWTPNKAVSLTGVRAAFAIAPSNQIGTATALRSLGASWIIGGSGVAMLSAWIEPAVQERLATSLIQLRIWKQQQIEVCESIGWRCIASDANFFCVRPDKPIDLKKLRHFGIKLRDCTSFGLPNHFRLSVQPPESQKALRDAIVSG